MKKCAVISAINQAHGDYFIHNWLPSLQATTDLTDIQVVVIDMGLSAKQRRTLATHVEIVPCAFTIHPTSARFLTIEQYLQRSRYQAVLLIDGGDIFFQDTIVSMFRHLGDQVLAAQCSTRGLFYEVFLPSCFPWIQVRQIYDVVCRQPCYSAGVIVGTRKAMLQLLAGMNPYLQTSTQYGADQIIFNYIGHSQRLIGQLDERYNFAILTGWEPFLTKAGKVYDHHHRLVAVVHNAGRFNFMRVFNDFGFGKSAARLNWVGLSIRRLTSPFNVVMAQLLMVLNTAGRSNSSSEP